MHAFLYGRGTFLLALSCIGPCGGPRSPASGEKTPGRLQGLAGRRSPRKKSLENLNGAAQEGGYLEVMAPQVSVVVWDPSCAAPLCSPVPPKDQRPSVCPNGHRPSQQSHRPGCGQPSPPCLSSRQALPDPLDPHGPLLSARSHVCGGHHGHLAGADSTATR